MRYYCEVLENLDKQTKMELWPFMAIPYRYENNQRVELLKEEILDLMDRSPEDRVFLVDDGGEIFIHNDLEHCFYDEDDIELSQSEFVLIVKLSRL